MKEMNKAFLLLAVLFVAVLGLIGCGRDSDEPVTLSIMAAQDWIRDVEQFVLAPMFYEETGIRIDFQIIPSEQYDDLLATRLATNTTTDIFMGQSGTLNIGPRYRPEENAVALCNEPWAARYDPVVRAASSYNGQLWGMTIWNVDAVWAQVYNRTIFDRLGLTAPRTWAELQHVNRTLLAAGITPLYMCVADLWHPVCTFVEMFVQIENLQPGTFNGLNNNSVQFTDMPMAVTLLEQINEVAQNYSGDSFLSNTFGGGAHALAYGNYAMMVNRPALINEIATNFPDAPYGAAENWGVFVSPFLDNQIRNVNPQGPTRFISSGSDHIEEAKLYLNFLAENLHIFIEQEPMFTSLPFRGTTPDLSIQEQEFFNNFPVTGEVMQSAVSFVDPQWMDIGSDLQALFVGLLTPEEVLRNMDRRRADQAREVGDPNWPR